MSNSLNQRRRRSGAQIGDQYFAHCAIIGVDPDFDQFVMVQRQQNLMHDRRRNAAVADDHHRLAVVGQGFEMAFLRVGQSLHTENRNMAKESGSVTGAKGMTVAPSPLNEVKLDLGIILTVGVLLLLVQGRLVGSVWVQLLVLASYGLLGMLWIVLRTRRIMARLDREREQEQRAHAPH